MYKKCCNAVMTPSSCVSSTVNGDRDEICIMPPLMLVVFLRVVLNRIKPHRGIRFVPFKPEVLLRVSHWKRGGNWSIAASAVSEIHFGKERISLWFQALYLLSLYYTSRGIHIHYIRTCFSTDQMHNFCTANRGIIFAGLTIVGMTRKILRRGIKD